MESVPLIPDAKDLPTLDVAPILRKIFHKEFEAVVPSKKVSQNILTSLQYERPNVDDKKTFRSVDYPPELTKKDNAIEFAENVLEAYRKHEKNIELIREAEKNVFETHVEYLKREKKILENDRIRELLSLKQQPLFKPLKLKYVNRFKLLQGDVGLPPAHEANLDFRVRDFNKWRRRLEDMSDGPLIDSCFKPSQVIPPLQRVCEKKDTLPATSQKSCKPLPQEAKPKNKKKKKKKKVQLFRADPEVMFFTEYKLGDVYIGEIEIKNVHTKGLKFQLKPTSPDGPFKVILKAKDTTKLYPGLSFKLTVEFAPKTLENAMEDIVVVIEDHNQLLVPLIAYLDPPVLKTHDDISETTAVTSERIASSYIECGPCFTGNSKITKLRFHCYKGSGEFFIMSFDNWNKSYVDTVSCDNFLEIPPFRVYPVFFKMDKGEVIDLFVEFSPEYSGTHVENIMITCDNGEVRSLDLLADAVGWHSYFCSIQNSLLKDLPPDKEDDAKVKFYLDFDDVMPTSKAEKVFCVSNNSNMSFEFQWKIREANITSSGDKYLKLSKCHVKIDPERGTFEPNSVSEFLVTLTFNDAEVGDYRTVLSLYVLNLPYQSIEEDDTIIQPTGFVRNLYSQSLYGEEEFSSLSPELLSLQGTYESLQESIKSYVECQNKVQAAPRIDFCKTVCLPSPGLCAKPLKKSKTFFNIGESTEDEDLTCACRMRPMEEESSTSESCTSNTKEEKIVDQPRNEVIWDFVDILVDEIELCVEVVRTRATMEPSVIELSDPLSIGDPPVVKQVKIINHNRSPITCSWLEPPLDKNPTTEYVSNKNVSFTLLFDGKQGHKPKEEYKADEQSKDSMNSDTGGRSCKIGMEPQKVFGVLGLSEVDCTIEISACQPGKIREALFLSINDGDLLLKLLILGTTTTDYFTISPRILDFGVLRSGTRYFKEVSLFKTGPDPLFWQSNQFEFNFKEDKFIGTPELEHEKFIKGQGVISNGNMALERFHLDARVPGIKCSLVEIEVTNLKSDKDCSRQYILAIGDVKTPSLSLWTPRFENAILAPSGLMYVGLKISTKVVLRNRGNVETFLSWGHPFGCHSRKIKVDINPKHCRIEKNKKICVNIDLTPLDKGIISHCYIPCFFCRSVEPLILSIVGIVEKLNVTFEILDYPGQTHADTNTFSKSPWHHTVLRMPWPPKLHNPNLSKNYIKQEDILTLKCFCSEVEEEANRAFRIQNIGTESSKESQEITVATNRPFQKTTYRSENFCSSAKLDNSDDKITKRHLEENSLVKYSISRASFLDALQNTKLHLEFLKVPFRTPVVRQFVIRNETPLATTFKISVMTFGLSQDLPNKRIEKIKNKVMGYSKDDFEDKLAKNQPLVVIVNPTEGELLGFDALNINVFAYGNTWGEYSDRIICKIKGIETAFLKIFVQIVGHPIHFPIFDKHTSAKPTLRFEPLSVASHSSTKRIKVVNRSSIPLIVTWFVFVIEPLIEYEEEEDVDLYSESNANQDSSPDASSSSIKAYIPKNATESTSPSQIMSRGGVSQYSGSFESFESHKNECDGEKAWSFPGEGGKSERQPFTFRGRLDNKIFQVEPKEISFNAFEEKKMKITFNSDAYKLKTFSQQFKGVLTGCVKLSPKAEKSEDTYFRPCGINFLSELMDFEALVETPLLSFDIPKGDLEFIVDANAVLKSPNKEVTMTRRFVLRNNKEMSVQMKIDIMPGVIFQVKSINTFRHSYPKYNPDKHKLKIEAGQALEMELQCSVTYKDVMYAYERLKQNRRTDLQVVSPEGMTTTNVSQNTEEDSGKKLVKEPWQDYFNCPFNSKEITQGESPIRARDSFEINLNRMASKSDHSICRNYAAEFEGEFLEIPCAEESPKPELPSTVTMKEEIFFVQSELVTQSLPAEVQLSFPMVKLSSKCVDFGNVYLDTPAVRYVSIINPTGFATEFRVNTKNKTSDFVVSPLTGNVPATIYNSDIGRTITIQFKPSQPGHFKETFQIFANPDMEFDFQELFVSGFGTWNEKYKPLKYEHCTKLKGAYSNIQK